MVRRPVSSRDLHEIKLFVWGDSYLYLSQPRATGWAPKHHLVADEVLCFGLEIHPCLEFGRIGTHHCATSGITYHVDVPFLQDLSSIPK